MSRNHDLEIALPDPWGGLQEVTEKRYQIQAGKITFSSQSDRNQVLVDDLYSRFVASGTFDYTAFFSTARELWEKEIGHSDFASGRLLAMVAKDIDVLQLAVDRIRVSSNAFDVLHIVAAYLVHAEDLNIDSLIELTRAQNDGTKGDIMAGMLYGSLEKWLASHPLAARALYENAIANADEVTANLANVALIGLSISAPDEAVNLSISLLSFKENFIRRVGRWTCGRLLLQSNISKHQRSEIEQIILSGLLDTDADARGESIRAASGAMHLSPAFDQELMRCAQSEDQSVLRSIAEALFLKSEALLAEERFFVWLPLLVALAPTGNRTIDGLDYVLSLQLEEVNFHQPEVIAFLSAWVSRHSGSNPIDETFAEQFDQCMYKIAEHPHLLATILTDWLSNSKRELAAAVAGMLSKLEVSNYRGIHLNADLLNAMDVVELQFLARRILGFVHGTENLISIGLSFLRMKDDFLEKVLPLIESLIVREIGYDYPGSTIEAIKSVEQGESRAFVISALQTWRSAIEASQSVLEQLPRRNGLRPSSRLERQFTIVRSKQMERARKDAAKNSIISQIATNIPLKAGTGFFNHARGEFKEPSTLHTVSYSVEIPRREVLDPIGNAIRGYHLRTIRKTAL